MFAPRSGKGPICRPNGASVEGRHNGGGQRRWPVDGLVGSATRLPGMTVGRVAQNALATNAAARPEKPDSNRTESISDDPSRHALERVTPPCMRSNECRVP